VDETQKKGGAEAGSELGKHIRSGEKGLTQTGGGLIYGGVLSGARGKRRKDRSQEAKIISSAGGSSLSTKRGGVTKIQDVGGENGGSTGASEKKNRTSA